MSATVLAQGGPERVNNQLVTDAEERELSLEVGEQTTISASDVRSYSEGVPGIVDVRVPPEGGQFVIVALRPGVTSLLLLYRDGRQLRYRLRVRDPNLSRGAAGRIEVPNRVNIRLDFYFVGLNENYSHQVGVGWPGTIGGQGVFQASAAMDLTTGTISGATASLVNQPLPRLDLAQSNGWARVYRHAVMVTANGNEVHFRSGGEVNVMVVTGLAAALRTINFGADVRVQPRYDEASGRVEVKVDAEVADLEDAGPTGLPNRSVAKLETLVGMEMGQGIVLAGLFGLRERRNKSGLPGLSQIPILGILFGSHRQANEDTENLLFIVPTVVEAVARDRRDLVDEALRAYEGFDGDVDEPRMIEGRPPGYGGATPVPQPSTASEAAAPSGGWTAPPNGGAGTPRR